MARRDTEPLPAGYVLTVTADIVSSGSVRRFDDSPQRHDPVSVAASGSVSIGPFTADRQYEILSDNGQLTVAIARSNSAGAAERYDFAYDFSIDGGTIGTIALRGDNPLPSGFIATAAFTDVKTALDSAAHTATGALTTGESAGDMLAAIIVTNASWATLGATRLTIVKKMTAARTPSLVVAVQNLTQGKFTLHVDGYMAT